MTATEALDAGAIDLIATDQDDLLTQLDGFAVKGPKATRRCDTAGLHDRRARHAASVRAAADPRQPDVAYLLLLVGLVGIAIEIFSPGLILPGTLGVVSLLLGAYGTAQLPVTAVGIALLVIGIALLIAEAHLPTHGILGAVGVIALAASGLLLFNTDSSAFEVSAPVVIVVARAARRRARVRGHEGGRRHARTPVQTGREELIGADRRRPRAARPGRPGLRRRGAVAGPARRRRRRRRGRAGSASAALECGSRRSRG